MEARKITNEEMLKSLHAKFDTIHNQQYRIPGIYEPELTGPQRVLNILIGKVESLINHEPVNINEPVEYFVGYNSQYCNGDKQACSTPLNLAVHFLDSEVVQYLFDIGAKADDHTFRVVDQSNDDYKNIIQTLLKNGVDINAKHGHTALYAAKRFHGERAPLENELYSNGARLTLFEHPEVKVKNAASDAITTVVFANKGGCC